MLPIDKFSITEENRDDGLTFLSGRFRYDHTSLLTREQARQKHEVGRTKDHMRKTFWDMAYADLRGPLNELMYLARLAADANPGRYPEAARIEELTEKINELLDWRKQLAAKQEGETK